MIYIVEFPCTSYTHLGMTQDILPSEGPPITCKTDCNIFKKKKKNLIKACQEGINAEKEVKKKKECDWLPPSKFMSNFAYLQRILNDLIRIKLTKP